MRITRGAAFSSLSQVAPLREIGKSGDFTLAARLVCGNTVMAEAIGHSDDDRARLDTQRGLLAGCVFGVLSALTRSRNDTWTLEPLPVHERRPDVRPPKS